jgi:hypothetical protein
VGRLPDGKSARDQPENRQLCFDQERRLILLCLFNLGVVSFHTAFRESPRTFSTRWLERLR